MIQGTRFRMTPIVGEKLGQWNPPVILNHNPVSYTIQSEDQGRPDRISQKVYGTSDYDWLILYYNGILDPFKELVVGKVIRIPDLSAVKWL